MSRSHHSRLEFEYSSCLSKYSVCFCTDSFFVPVTGKTPQTEFEVEILDRRNGGTKKVIMDLDA